MSTLSNAVAGAALPLTKLVLTVQLSGPIWSSEFKLDLFLSYLLEHKELLKGWVFEATEEATMAGWPFQEHLKGLSVQELLCLGEAPGLVSSF